MRLKSGKVWNFSARLLFELVNLSEEPHPHNLRNLDRTDLGQYGTESTATAGSALV
jgi:hypothetical protein